MQKGLVLYEFDSEHLKDILKYAERCESVVYNSSTTIDPIISVYGYKYSNRNLRRFYLPMCQACRSCWFSRMPTKRRQLSKGRQMQIMKHSYPFVESIHDSIDVILEKSIETLGDIGKNIWNLNETDTSHAWNKNSIHLDCWEKLSIKHFLQTSILLFCYIASLLQKWHN